MSLDIHILLDILLAAGIFAAVRFYFILGQVRQSLTNLEETRSEISGTLQHLESVAKSTEEVLRTEVTPTLQVTRATLANLEVTTRALADTTLAVRSITGRAEQAVSAQRLLTAALPIARMMTAKGGGIASGFIAGIGTGIKAILSKKRSKTTRAPQLEPADPAGTSSNGTAANPILLPDSATDRRPEPRKQRSS